MAKKDYSRFFSDARKRESYWIADATYSFVEDLHMATVEQGITYAQLAAKIGKSPAYITRVMRGDYNLTIATMVKLARALDLKLKLGLENPALEITASFSVPALDPKSNIVEFPKIKEGADVSDAGKATPAA